MRGAYDTCGTPYYIGPIRHQQFVPASAVLNLGRPAGPPFYKSESKEGSIYPAPVLPQKEPGMRRPESATNSATLLYENAEPNQPSTSH